MEIKRRETSIALVAMGAGLTALGTKTMGTFLIFAGLFGLWNSGEETSKSCINHMLKYARSRLEKRFPITG